jgi:hypothetical protein
VTARRFPPPWSVDDSDTIGRTCYSVRDADWQALAYGYFEAGPEGL